MFPSDEFVDPEKPPEGHRAKTPGPASRSVHRERLRPTTDVVCLNNASPLCGRYMRRPEQMTAFDTLNAVGYHCYSDVHHSAFRALCPHDLRSHGTKAEHSLITNEKALLSLETPDLRAWRPIVELRGPGLSSPLFPQTAPGPVDLATHSMLRSAMAKDNRGTTQKASFSNKSVSLRTRGWPPRPSRSGISGRGQNPPDRRPHHRPGRRPRNRRTQPPWCR